MNAITRLILHRLASGKIRLTPEIMEVLKTISEVQVENEKSEKAERQRESSPKESTSGDAATDRRLTFVNPLAGRWIRRTSCALGSALFLAAGLFRATASPNTFDAANSAFGQGNYAEGVRGFESVIAQRGYSAPVLFNLANAQQKAGQLGRAILNYERAKLLSSNDPDVAANLRQAREKAGLGAEQPSPIQEATQCSSLNGWASLSVVALLLLVGALLFKRLWPQTRLFLNLGCGAAGLALAISLTAMAIRWSDLDRAVVTGQEVVAGISPVDKAQAVFKMHTGEVVTLKRTHGDFALIKNQAGHEGWVKAGDVERIIPASAKTARS